jgi:hypothetical protein
VGIAGRLGSRRLRIAQLTPHGKGVSGSYNQLTHFKIATMNTKTVLKKEIRSCILKTKIIVSRWEYSYRNVVFS